MSPVPAANAWYENDEAWARFERVIFPPERLAAAAWEIQQVSTLLPLRPGSDVLDLCCGIGRHTLELARSGHRVVGVDRTPHFLARARERAAREGLSLELVHERMHAFVRPAAFDAAISLYTSFGYHDDPEHDRRTLANVRESLRPGGKLVVQLNGKDEVAANFRARHLYRLDDSRYVLEETSLHDGGSRSENRWTLLDADGRHEFRFKLRLYSAAELAERLRSCGFATVDIRGGLDGRPYDTSATHVVAVATA